MEGPLQFPPEQRGLHWLRRPFKIEQIIPGGQLGTKFPKYFPSQTFQPVAIDRLGNFFFNGTTPRRAKACSFFFQ